MKQQVFNISRVLPKNTVWPQCVAGITATLMMIEIGLMGGWTSPYLAKLTEGKDIFVITASEASWVASLLNLGRPVGAIIGAVSVELFGSKMALLVSGIPTLLCWVFIIAASSVEWIYAARYFGGTGIGMIYTSFPLYLGEISDPSIRGALVSMAMSGVPLGTLFGNIIGPYVTMRNSAYISLAPLVIAVALLIWLPESPHHLIRKDKTEDAKKSVLWYHREAEVEAEVKALEQFVNGADTMSFMDKCKTLRIPQYWKAVVLIIILYMFMQISGLNSITYYMQIILENAEVVIIDPAIIVIIIGTIGIISGWVSMYLIEKCGRRILIVISSIGVVVALCALGLHFMLLQYEFDSGKLQWLPITSLMVFQVFVLLGLMPVPSTVLSELCPPEIKSTVSCVASISSGAFAFASSKTYQPLSDAIGMPFYFWTNAFVMAFIIPYTLLFMPETKGKTLQEIQDTIMKK